MTFEETHPGLFEAIRENGDHCGFERVDVDKELLQKYTVDKKDLKNKFEKLWDEWDGTADLWENINKAREIFGEEIIGED